MMLVIKYKNFRNHNTKISKNEYKTIYFSANKRQNARDIGKSSRYSRLV